LIKKVADNIEQAKNSVEASKIDDALAALEESLELAKTHNLTDSIKEILDLKEKAEVKQLVLKAIQDAKDAISAGSFEAAEKLLNGVLETTDEYNFPKEAEEIKYILKNLSENKNQLERDQKIFAKLAKLVDEYSGKEKWSPAIENCKKLIEIASAAEKADQIPIYEEKLKEYEQKYKAQQDISEKQETEFQEKAKELESIIQPEVDCLPDIEEFPIDDIMGVISDDANAILNQLDNILQDHRVEVSNDVPSKTVLRSKSGETMELESTLTVLPEPEPSGDSDKPKSNINCVVSSGLENPFDDYIEEAILEDIIPYNFEITELRINDEIPAEPPEKTMVKGGMQVKWTLRDIAPKQKVNIQYDLRKRVSRTIIIPLKDTLKIVKTHSNLSPLQIEGLFNAELKFTNAFDEILKGIVIEDILPPSFLYDIKRPHEEEHDDDDDKLGSLVKWKLRDFMTEADISHEYQLIDVLIYEELKIKIYKIEKEGFAAVEADELDQGLGKYQEVVDILKEYN
jgi:hypothetical protein